MILLVWLILFLLLIAPVTVRVDLHCVQSLRALIALRVWGIGPSLRYCVIKTDQGHRLLHLDRHGNPKPRTRPPSSSNKAALQILRQAFKTDLIRRYVFHGIALQQLDVALNISLDNAAQTALTAGGLQSVWRALPGAWRRKARLQVRPDFLNGQGGLQARCMVFFHLGTLFITAAMLLLSFALERIGRPVHPAEEA